MMFYTLVLQFFQQKIGKTKREDDTFLRKKTEEKQNGATAIASVNGKGEVVPMKLKLQEELFEKTY